MLELPPFLFIDPPALVAGDYGISRFLSFKLRKQTSPLAVSTSWKRLFTAVNQSIVYDATRLGSPGVKSKSTCWSTCRHAEAHLCIFLPLPLGVTKDTFSSTSKTQTGYPDPKLTPISHFLNRAFAECLFSLNYCTSPSTPK